MSRSHRDALRITDRVAASADRRPVDPPPIVELTIFQGEKREEDITFAMNANYFLFATLEPARSILPGRLPQDKTSIPVLTGTPVAGMVYLDRPKPAGYFIFPDLSVRHEGKYRLNFSLYEELKHAKDDDKMAEGASSPTVPGEHGDHHVTHRLDVRSAPFHVYSAKKFPGLTESTSLSRMVAEQGCRVRIRRDVRMRRRDPKNGSKDWDDYEDDTASARARQQSGTPDPNVYSMVQTPQGYMEQINRPRSASNASGHHSLGNSISRRPSLQDNSQPYHQPQYATAPHTPQHAYPTQTSPYTTQAQQFPPAALVQQQPPLQPPPPPQYQASYPTHSQFPGAPPQPGFYGTQSSPVPSQTSQGQAQYNASPQHYDSAPQAPRSSMDYPAQAADDYRRNSNQHVVPPPPPPPPHLNGYSQPTSYQQQSPLSAQHNYPQPPVPQASQHMSHLPMDIYNRPAPLETLHPPARATGAHTPLTTKPSFDLPPINTAIMPNNRMDASSPVSSSAPQSSYFSSTQTPHDTHKRSFGNVFSDRHQAGPLRQGARPSMYGQRSDGSQAAAALADAGAVDDDDSTSTDLDPEMLGMHYRRADGRQILRALPGRS